MGLGTILLSACAASNTAVSTRPTAAASQQSVRPVQPNAQASGQQGAQNNAIRAQSPVPQPITAQRRAALLLPLTGPQAAVGKPLKNAALLAVQDLAPPNFELEVYDTAKGATAAFNEARAGGAQLVIGPLFSADVQAIRADAQAANIPVLALSNDTSLAGQGVYVAGFWPGAQITRVANFAAQRGQRNLAALVPGDAYGQRVAEALAQVRLKTVALARYAPDTNPEAVASQLTAQRGQYDTLLLAEGGARAVALIAALQAQGLLTQANGQPVQLLGSGLWDSPELARQAGLTGAWYAAPDPANHAAFDLRYRQAFGEGAPRIASLAYDTTALAAVLAAKNWPYTPQYLVQTQGFDGIDGLFRLRPEGLAERGLAVLEFTPNGPQLVDPAPKQF